MAENRHSAPPEHGAADHLGDQPHGDDAETAGRLERSTKMHDHEECNGVGRVVARYPYPALLAGAGLGFGLGLVVTLMLNQRRPSLAERYLPESFQQIPDRLRRLPESLGAYVPSSWRAS